MIAIDAIDPLASIVFSAIAPYLCDARSSVGVRPIGNKNSQCVVASTIHLIIGHLIIAGPCLVRVFALLTDNPSSGHKFPR